MSFGLRNASQTFQRFADKVIRGLYFVYANSDGVLIAIPTTDEHMEHLATVFDRLQHIGVVLNPSKCVFAEDSLRATEDPENWTDDLPLIILGIRSVLKSNLGCPRGELVFGATVRLPGEVISPTLHVAARDPTNLLHHLQQFMWTLSPVPSRLSVSESSLEKDLGPGMTSARTTRSSEEQMKQDAKARSSSRQSRTPFSHNANTQPLPTFWARTGLGGHLRTQRNNDPTCCLHKRYRCHPAPTPTGSKTTILTAGDRPLYAPPPSISLISSCPPQPPRSLRRRLLPLPPSSPVSTLPTPRKPLPSPPL
ncbi:hypothetical protein SprV_0501751500 [Sparganum proliferum]